MKGAMLDTEKSFEEERVECTKDRSGGDDER